MAAEVVENGVENKVEDKQKVSDGFVLAVLLMEYHFRRMLWSAMEM